MSIRRSSDAYTNLVARGAKENAKRIRTREEILQKQADERLAEEQARIHQIAENKKHETVAKDDGYDVGDVDWPAYYGVSSTEALPESVQRLIMVQDRTEIVKTRKETIRDDAMVSAICSVPISLEELIDYVEHVKPDKFAWGEIPRGGNAMAYHASRYVSTSQTLMYKIHSTQIVQITQTGNNITYVNPSVSQRTYAQDTPAGLLYTSYESGMLLDVTTLIAVLARRTSCVMNNNKFPETKSYPIFEQWIAQVLELKSITALIYTYGVVGNVDDAREIHTRCTNCEPDVLDAFKQLRGKYWNA
jgi:hypothetical protein